MKSRADSGGPELPSHSQVWPPLRRVCPQLPGAETENQTEATRAEEVRLGLS